jgi:hypothetical protein
MGYQRHFHNWSENSVKRVICGGDTCKYQVFSPFNNEQNEVIKKIAQNMESVTTKLGGLRSAIRKKQKEQ